MADWLDHVASFVDFFFVCAPNQVARGRRWSCATEVRGAASAIGGMTPVGNKRRAAVFIHIFKAQLAATCSKVCACRKLSEPRNNVVWWPHTRHSEQVRQRGRTVPTKEVIRRPWRASSGCAQLIERHSRGGFRLAAPRPGRYLWPTLIHANQHRTMAHLFQISDTCATSAQLLPNSRNP